MFPSTSNAYAPLTRSNTIGFPPTDLNARTGEFTPPGRMSCAALKISLDRVVFSAGAWTLCARAPVDRRVVEGRLEVFARTTRAGVARRGVIVEASIAAVAVRRVVRAASRASRSAVARARAPDARRSPRIRIRRRAVDKPIDVVRAA